jgi:hypothetical protein
MFLSDAPDAIDRLWVMFGNYNNIGYFYNPIMNPLQAGTYSYVPTGQVIFPEYDKGFPEEEGLFYKLTTKHKGASLLQADIEPSDTLTYNILTAMYGLSGSSAVNTLGVIGNVSATGSYTRSFPLTFGSPYGERGWTVQLGMYLRQMYRYHSQGSLVTSYPGTTPVVEEVLLNYLTIPKERNVFDFTIDTGETARREVIPLEAVVGSLDYVKSSIPLVPFWYGRMGTKVVKIVEMPEGENVQSNAEEVYPDERSGFVQIRAIEL